MHGVLQRTRASRFRMRFPKIAEVSFLTFLAQATLFQVRNVVDIWKMGGLLIVRSAV